MRIHPFLVVPMFLGLVAACSSAETGSTTPEKGDASKPPTSTGSEDGGAPAVDATAPPKSDAAPAAQDSGGVVIDRDAGTATVSGFVSRSVALAAGLDGKGALFIALMDKNPITDRANAKALANALVRDADLSGAGAKVAFKIENVPVVNGELFVIAFFDDNANADMSGDGSKAAPDKGDLVNLDLASPLKVKIEKAGNVALDIVLNMALPF